MQLDLVAVVGEPLLALVVQPMAGAVVDHDEALASFEVLDQVKQKDVEGVSVEHRGELPEPLGIQGHRTEHVSRLPLAACRHARLVTDPRPGLVQGPVEPEARLVFEDDYASAILGFFFSAGSRSRTQVAWASGSARDRRLRGRCNENPIGCSNRGMCWGW